MKIVYHHIRRPPAAYPPSLEAYIESGKKLLKFTEALKYIQQKEIPVNDRTRAKCQAVTICEIYPEAGEDITPIMGVAFCCDKDQFSRKIGRHISYGRARQALSAHEKRQGQLETTGPPLYDYPTIPRIN